MAQHDKKIIPEVPALDFSFGNYGQGTDYTQDSQRMKDLYLETNTNPDIRSFSNTDDIGAIAREYGLAIPKSLDNSLEMILNLPSMISYGGGLLAYGADYAIGGIEKGEGEKDYYDYVPHYEVDLARGRTPYEGMLIKPYGTILGKSIDTSIDSGKILFDKGLNEESMQEIFNQNPWLSTNYGKYSNMKVMGAPDPSSVQNTLEFGFMGLTSGTGYFSKIPTITKLAMNSKYIASGGLAGAGNSIVNEMFPDFTPGQDATQTMAFVGLNLVTDMLLRRSTYRRDQFLQMGLTKEQAISLEKNLPEIQKQLKESNVQTPLEAWQFISKLDAPGLQGYMRLLMQSEPRFQAIISKQTNNLTDQIDLVLDSPILLGKDQLAFTKNIDLYAVADNIIKRHGEMSKQFKGQWRRDVGEGRLNKDFSVNEKYLITEAINNFKNSTNYTRLSSGNKQEMDKFLDTLLKEKNMNMLDNAIKDEYLVYRYIEDGRIGQNINQNMKNSLYGIRKTIRETLNDFVDSNGNLSYKIANENYTANTQKYIESSPAYKIVSRINQHAKKGNYEAIIDEAIQGMYNRNLSNSQVDEILKVMDDIGGNTLVPDLLRIRIQQIAMDTAKTKDSGLQRGTRFVDSFAGNVKDLNTYKQVVKHILKDKSLKDNESAIIVTTLFDWIDSATKIPRIGNESFTGLYTKFQTDVGGGIVDDLNVFRWSDKIKQRYIEYNIGKMADLFTDKAFLEKLLEIKVRDPKDKSFVQRFITNAVIQPSYKVGGYGQLAQEEYRTWQYNKERSDEYYRENKKKNTIFDPSQSGAFR